MIVDLAAEQGGNVEGTRAGQDASTRNGVKIIGPVNLAAPVADRRLGAVRAQRAATSSRCRWTRRRGEFAIPRDDEIVKATMVVDNGAVVPRG